MKKKMLNFCAVAFIVTIISAGLVQMRLPVVQANGCATDPVIGCACNLLEAISVQEGELTVWYCTYGCWCPGPPGGEHFYIERTFQYYD